MIEALLVEAARRAARYLEGLEERAVAPSPAHLAGLRALTEGALPQQGLPAERVLAAVQKAK